MYVSYKITKTEKLIEKLIEKSIKNKVFFTQYN